MDDNICISQPCFYMISIVSFQCNSISHCCCSSLSTQGSKCIIALYSLLITTFMICCLVTTVTFLRLIDHTCIHDILLVLFSWHGLDGTDPAAVGKIVKEFLDYGKMNKESVGELFITLLIKVTRRKTTSIEIVIIHDHYSIRGLVCTAI